MTNEGHGDAHSLEACTVTFLRLNRVNPDTGENETRLLTHCQLCIENDECFKISRILLDFVRLVKGYEGLKKVARNGCLGIMQCREMRRDIVAVYCALDICIDELRMKQVVNVREVIRNVRTQLNAPNTCFTTLGEYACVFRALIRYSRLYGLSDRSNKYPKKINVL